MALVDAGFARKRRHYYEIDPLENGFNAQNAVIFLHQRINLEKFQLEAEDFRPFSRAGFSSLGEVPNATAAYYRETFEKEKRPLVYLFVPHILYHGTLDITSARIIEVF